MAPRCPCSPLVIIFTVTVSLLASGIIVAIIDIERYGAGLYLALVSVVVVVVALAFCLVGTDEQTEPTVAKKVWSTTRQTIRRYAKKESTRVIPPINIVHIDLDVDSKSLTSGQREDDTGRSIRSYEMEEENEEQL